MLSIEFLPLKVNFHILERFALKTKPIKILKVLRSNTFKIFIVVRLINWFGEAHRNNFLALLEFWGWDNWCWVCDVTYPVTKRTILFSLNFTRTISNRNIPSTFAMITRVRYRNIQILISHVSVDVYLICTMVEMRFAPHNHFGILSMHFQ